MSAILSRARDLLQGEPLRAITYGAAVIIYLAARTFAVIPDEPFDTAVTQAVAAAAVLVSVVEFARRYVSPAS